MLVTTALLVALGGLAGCQNGGGAEAESPSDEQSSDEPAAQVDLPSPPSSSAFEIKEKNSDGTLRVRGLVAHRGKYLGETVEVKGIIDRISGDCDPEEAEARGDECQQPHLLIKDAPDADTQMLVVGYRSDLPDDADLETGQTHTFKGTYKEMGQGFVASENGLIVLDEVDGTSAIKN